MNDALEIYNNYFGFKQYEVKHIVLIIWKDPFDMYSHRSGAFDDYVEATIFANMMNEFYCDTDFAYTIYIDGSVWNTQNWGVQ